MPVLRKQAKKVVNQYEGNSTSLFVCTHSTYQEQAAAGTSLRGLGNFGSSLEDTVLFLSLKSQEHAKKFAQLKDDYEQMRNDKESLREDYKKLEQGYESMRQANENLSSNCEKLSSNFDNMRKEKENLKSSLQESIRESEKLKLQLSTMEGRLQYLEAINLQITPRTCQTIADLGVKRTGKYFVDPDGVLFGNAPIQVLCDMETGRTPHALSTMFRLDPVSTIVLHDSMGSTVIDNCADPGCYSRRINYGSPIKQMTALIDQSDSCEQQIRYDCFSAALITGDTQYGWWVDRHGQRQYYWHGSRSGEHVCKCGISRDCIDSSLPCNCDAGAPQWESDVGAITNKTALPVTELRFGGLRFGSQKANYTLGGLTCRSKSSSASNPAEHARLSAELDILTRVIT
ncbi:unnamed protein product [Darwinula stevensoni]|uniref:Uncharacterized protein n=1 Tax=Darwinula stevensoni TaxID=69355 RepID=A0A7R8XGI4_9CRUS|nr:unnamed protein product [Darwinula stevensoni]CAG0889755.1 unnamed protein product [Darwinula stevensoni]